MTVPTLYHENILLQVADQQLIDIQFSYLFSSDIFYTNLHQ